MDEKVPKVGEFWRHRNGTLYMVTLLTNRTERTSAFLPYNGGICGG